MKIAISILLIACMAVPALATSQTNGQILTALGMAWEYRQFLDGYERATIEEVVKIEGEKYRVRVLFEIPKYGGGERAVRRDVYLDIRATSSGVSPWWIIAGLAAGFVAGYAAK